MNKSNSQDLQFRRKSPTPHHRWCSYPQHKKAPGEYYFLLFLFVFLLNTMVMNAPVALAGGVFGPQSSNKNIEWGFDFVETFDGLQDWKGTILNDDVMVWKNGANTFPKHLDGSDSNWEFYSNWKPSSGNDWIANHGSENVWGSTGKSMIIDLSNDGWGPNGFGLYFGDGSPWSGYDDIYIFHMMRIPNIILG